MKSNRMAALCAAIVVVLSLALSQYATAQTTSGSIVGVVTDATGAVIPNVTVSAKSTESGNARSVVTDNSGAYKLLSVPPGIYDVTASGKGFSTGVRRQVAVDVVATVTVNFALTVGNVQETVEVTSETPQVETNDASLSGVVGEHAIRELPLNGRDWVQLATLQPGVVAGIGQPSASSYSNSRAARGNGLAMSISGNRPTGNVFLVDGLVVNDYANASPGSGLNVNLGVEAVREFRVFTDEYTAEYGRSTGGVVTAIFKSGTNNFHGNLYEFLRNSAFDARNFYDTTAPQFQRNQFGASIGGPIRRDKTFFFVDYEALILNQGVAHQSPTLSPDARRGLICKDSNCTSKTQVQISPKIQPYLPFFPDANGKINGDEGFYNFSGKRIGREHYGTTKIDHNFSQSTTLSGSYQIDNTDESQPDPYNQKRTGSPSRHQNGVVTLQHIFSPQVLNTTMFGVSRTHATDALDVSAINPISANTALAFQPGAPGAGILGVADLATQGGMGSSGADVLNYTSIQWGDDASWTHGRHTFKFGGKGERMRYNKNSLVGAPFGEWDFNTIDDFLTNNPALFTTDVPGTSDIRYLRTTYLGMYFEDSIALTRNFHLNAGVRYEWLQPITETKNQVDVLVNLADANPKLGGSYFHTNTKNFAPRLGLAWDPFGDGKTSVRAGFGMYDVLPFPYLLENRTNGAPYFEQGTINTPPASAFPTGGLSLIKPGSFRAAYVQQNPQRAYSMQWNLSIERQLTGSTALTIGYLGSRANHLPRSIEDANQVPINLVTRAADGHLLFPTNPALKNGGPIQRINPNYSRIAATIWDDFSSYNGLVATVEKRFSHGLFFKGAYTWSKSIDEGSNTFSDNEATNTSGVGYAFLPQLQRGVSDFDISHRLVMNYSWLIPTPSAFSGFSKAALGGWELGGIFSAQSGPPFSVTLKNDQARTGDSRVGSSSGGQRPDFLPGPGCSTNAINPGNPFDYIKMGLYGSPQCFAFPALGTLGNLGRNTLRGPGMQDFDASLFKNWPLWNERSTLQFRVEAFNLFNKPNFQAPKTKIFDGKGKAVSSAPILPSPTATSEREIQFALKLSW